MSAKLETQTSATSTKDRRRSERNEHVFEAALYSPTAKKNEPRIAASSVNLSQHGVGFETERPIPVNAFFMLEIQCDSQRLLSEVQIVSCTKTDRGNYLVGAEFY